MKGAVFVAFALAGLGACHSVVPFGDAESPYFKLNAPAAGLGANVWISSGQLYYDVFLGNYTVIQASHLGLVRNDVDLSRNLSTLSCGNVSRTIEKYELLKGKTKKISCSYHRYTCSTKTASGSILDIHWALSDRSVAFRYAMPEDTSISSRAILHESTTFDITKSPGDYQIAQPYDGPTPKYQTFYQPRNDRRRTPIGGGNSTKGFAFPALFHAANRWLLLKEAGFDGAYPASHLRDISANGSVSLGFPTNDDANGAFGPGAPQSPLPWKTPWRIIALGNDVADIISDTSVTDLSEPSQITDTTWIQPGACSWSWWSDSQNPLNYTATRQYIDLASLQGWKYSLLDSMWDQQVDSQGRNVSLSEFIAYANSKNVKLWLWVNSAGPNNNATENTPRDLLYQREIRRATMARLSQAGIAGLKVDGIQSDKQQMMSYLLDILRDAADFKLMVVFHNCPLPHGWERTWPNLVSSEALIASEYYTNNKTAYSPQMPENNVNEAFVRVPIGPADYSPGVFSLDSHPTDATHTTYAHEVALNVIIDSGLHIFPDSPEAYNSLVSASIMQLLGSVPFVWDETTFLQGEPGKFFVVAKRHGTDLYVAGINGETLEIDANSTINRAVGLARNITVDLSIFSLNMADILSVSDIAGSREAQVTASRLNSSRLSAHMEPFGGFVWKITSI